MRDSLACVTSKSHADITVQDHLHLLIKEQEFT